MRPLLMAVSRGFEVVNTNNYARWFRDSTPYISAHRNKTFVVVLGGDAVMHANLTNIVHDLALLNVLGVRLVVVHGAREQIDMAIGESSFHESGGHTRRITDQNAMRTIAGVYGQIRSDLEALFSTGLPTSPLHNTDIQLVSGNFVTAKPIGVLDGTDHQLTGLTRKVHVQRIDKALDTGAIVLLSPIGYSPSGQAFNLTADELSEQVAITLRADKLIVFDSVPYLGDANDQRLSNFTPTVLDKIIDTVAIQDSTRRRLRTLVRAVRGGVTSGQLVSYADDGALLEELFTADGVGTQVTEQDRRLVRRATLEDVADIVAVIRPLEDAGALVRRSRDRLEREIDQFFVAEVDGIVIGCCALYPAGTSVELACVAVHESYRQENSGHPSVGKKLLDAAVAAALANGYQDLFALTTQARDWFLEHGFEDADLDDLPTPKQAMYNYNRNSKVLKKKLGH